MTRTKNGRAVGIASANDSIQALARPQMPSRLDGALAALTVACAAWLRSIDMTL